MDLSLIVDLSDINVLKSILTQYGIRPNKFLGQHFLIDRKVLEKIIETAAISPGDLILEIGPGIGVLTLELAKRAKKVIAVEKDEKLVKILEDNLKKEKISNVEIIVGDILEEIKNPKSKIQKEFKGKNYKIVANLPYYLTNRLIRNFLENPPAGEPPKEMVLMVQKEVGERICAQPPKMNILAVSVQFYGQPEITAFVPKKSFWPKPEVDSAIIKLKTKNGNRKINEKREFETEKFFKIVRAGFSSPRKTLMNNLKKIMPRSIRRDFEFSLKKIGLRPDCRPQNLSVDNWREIVLFIEKKCDIIKK